MAATPDIRLPGVYFLPPPRVAPVGLPPLDVTGFVGFAERGPLNTPVPIEDVNVYTAIFGGDFPLAREEDGRTVYACLPNSVRGFFANGGRRCWVVRVAGDSATRTTMVIPGLIALGAGSSGRLATLFTSSEGRWSERLRIATRLEVTPLPKDAFRLLSDGVEWSTGSAPQAILRGDLLRLTFTGGEQWLFPVSSTTAPQNATPETPVLLQAAGAWRVVSGSDPGLPAAIAEVRRLSADGPEQLDLTAEIFSANGSLELHLFGEQLDEPGNEEKIEPGDILRLDLTGGRRLLFPVSNVRSAVAAGSPHFRMLVATAEYAIEVDSGLPPIGSPAVLSRVERLRFDVYLKDGGDRRPPIAEVAFNDGHPRFWGEVALLESSSLYRRSNTDLSGNRASDASRLFRLLRQERLTDKDRDIDLDIASLAGLLSPIELEDKAFTYLPLGMPQILNEDDFIGPEPETLGSDGLDSFDPTVFVDPYLVANLAVQPSRGGALAQEAFSRAYVQNRRLRGIHSLFFIDEIALLSLPDSTHQGWRLVEGEPAGPVNVVSPPQPPSLDIDRALFIDCVPPELFEIEPSSGPVTGGTVVEVTGSGFIGGATTITFDGVPGAGVEMLSRASLRCATPPVGQAGPVVVEVTTPNGSASKPDAFTYEARPIERLPRPALLEDFNMEPLQQIQQAAIGFCEARSDVLCVLTLPLHFEKRQCIEWLELLRERLGLPKRGSVFNDVRDIADLSYAAVYHPWVLTSDTAASDRLRAAPPDGIVCGTIAARERERGVWVAPANIPLKGVLGFAIEISNEDWAELFELQFNLIRREPRDFRAMSAHTLSDQRDLLQVSVRRLMIMLRKAAMDLGMDYVFRPNNEHFREAVRMALEDLLRNIFDRGAFAGAQPSDSYRVTTDASVNTRESIDQGRFIAKIQVAPSEPMEFLTVLLTRVGDNLLQAAEV